MVKIYDFPQGKEKQKLTRQINAVKKTAAADIKKPRKESGFYILRQVLGSLCDVLLTVAVTLCNAVIYLTVIFGGFYLLLHYNSNGGVWDSGMWTVTLMIVFGLFKPGDVQHWHLFSRLLGVDRSEKTASE